jgi:pimeloyl-ACP methyl ester carboxylesterase
VNHAQSVRTVALHGAHVPVYEWRPLHVHDALAPWVLIHGYMDAGRSWDLVAPQLMSLGRVVYALDLRGYGDGFRAPYGSYYHFPDYILDLATILHGLGVPRAVLVGHSMGGVVSTLFAGSFPERVERLILIEGLGPPDHVPGTAPLRMRAFVEGTQRVWAKANSAPPTFTEAYALERLRANHPRVPEALLRSRLAHLVRDGGEGALQWRFDPLHRTRSPAAFLAATFCEFARAVLAPVLFVSGGSEGFHPEDEAARLAAFADLSSCTIEGAGHMVHWTQPEALASAMAAFVGNGAEAMAP